MGPRMNLQELEPGIFQAMMGVEKYLSAISLDKRLIDLIKIRASQLNGCAYCIQMHTEDTRSLGETEQRIYALSAWKESPLFSEQERAVLALTDEVTQISKKAVTDQTYQNCQQYFSDNEIAQCVMQITQINSWNRIALATKMIFD
ncbi:MAG: carboxymuconolactone decarboxylase family protein [Gammaproteobacteria bacterium]|nr:carboxymuconolactone decarboxylase family protein [Gammaproteobacteria bacterium]